VELGLAGGQRCLPVVAAIDDEHAHGHAKAGERLADALLHLDRAAHEAVVFERGETLCGHVFELRDRVGARASLNMPKCGAYLSLNLRGSRRALAASAAGRKARGHGGARGLLQEQPSIRHRIPRFFRALDADCQATRTCMQSPAGTIVTLRP
jgi:hypothetical protein